VRFQNGADPETNALKINLEAAEEIARQLRLRDMGGIIVVDFIDMRRAENRRQVHEHLANEMAKDRARHTVLPMSKFGLMQITRMRVRPEMKIATEEVCPTCNGTGKVTSSILIADQVSRNVEYLIRRSKIKQLRLKLHPYLAAYFKHGMPSQQLRWFWTYNRWIRIQADNSLPLSEAKYYDGRGEEIKLD
jgi:ribonuclease G